MGARVAGRGERLDERVAELDDVAVTEPDVRELDLRPRRQVGGRAGALDERRQPGDVIGLNVGLEDGRDRDPLGLGQVDVVASTSSLWGSTTANFCLVLQPNR